MSKYTSEQAKHHVVERVFSGKKDFFNVKTTTGTIHSVSVELRCDCRHAGIKGIIKHQPCSHMLAAIKTYIEHG